MHSKNSKQKLINNLIARASLFTELLMHVLFFNSAPSGGYTAKDQEAVSSCWYFMYAYHIVV